MEKEKRKMYTFNRNEGILLSAMVRDYADWLLKNKQDNLLLIHEFVGLYDKLEPVLDKNILISDDIKNLKEVIK